jgi:hypothetical protein
MSFFEDFMVGAVIGSVAASSAEQGAQEQAREYKLCVPDTEASISPTVGMQVAWLYKPYSGWIFRIPVAAEVVEMKRSKAKIRYTQKGMLKEKWVRAEELCGRR